MPSFIPPLRGRVPVVLVTTRLLTFASAWRAAALAIPDVGIAVFFIAGIATTGAGLLAPWFVLGAVLLGLACRTLDVEGWGVLVRGGLVGRAGLAFGPKAAAAAAAAQLLERVLFASLVSLVFGHYVAALPMGLLLPSALLPDYLPPKDPASLAAVVLLGFAWSRARLGYRTDIDKAVARTWAAVAIIVVIVAWAVIAVIAHPSALAALSPVGAADALALSAGPFASVLVMLFAFGHTLPAVGSGDSLARAATELEPPRIRGVWRTMVILTAYGGFVTVASTFLFSSLVPIAAQRRWVDVPILGMIQYLPGPPWTAALAGLAVVASATLLLGQAVRAGISGAERMLVQLAEQGGVTEALTVPHARLGTLARAIDTAAALGAVAILASAGRVEWLAHAYGACLVWTLLLKVTVLIRLRRPREDAPFRVPLNVHVGRSEWPLGLAGIALVVSATWVAMILSGDPPTIGASIALLGVALLFAAPARRLPTEPPEDLDPFRLLPAQALSLDQVEVRPGGVLVAVRNPNSLAHLSHAFSAAGERDIVVMTARLVGGLDGEYEDPQDARPTPAEQALFSNVIALAERHGRHVRLLIVPAHNVFDAAVAAVLRLQASDVFVGESATLSADAQARLLGEAWERGDTGELHGVRLVVHHQSGRSDTFHLGVHAPELSSRDLDLIHHVWLDAVRAVGPHVHHHDVVRAALTQMAEQLKGEGREDALRAIQAAARPADELAAIVRTRDYTKLRDMIRNRPADHLASLLADLSLEDQVVVFRLLPRKDAAATFEYLTLEQQEALLKSMAQENIAAVLNEMAPDDRTMFLEELPAPVTRQLLALLTPEERGIASTLLGYPEDSIGRLMTPAYIAVGEQWTIQQVLDYIRQHGQDSETLNVIHVVDEQGRLIDDLRIRELLLASPTSRVADLMDRRFVSLKATDDQAAAVALFREHDRTALPVTDTAGMLIGIVTIDDVLDVVEERTTEEIQRIGGSEALDEPYMVISFARMIQKRAGWLTALFLGEMLTASAMSAFEAEIERAVVLALFVPLIISSGGNSGSQASTLVIRALALGEVTLRDWWRVVRREIFAGLVLGGILGAIGFLRVSIWSAFSTIYGPHWLLIATTVGVTLVGIVSWGTLVGSLL
ncbi:MAG: magnesium transporter, partial [Vicinamibacterales bacterium]